MKKLSQFFIGLCFLLLSAHANAQTNTGADYFAGKWNVLVKGLPNGDTHMFFVLEKKDTTLTGVVQDSSGAVIANAQVTATNIDTGLALETKSNSSGVFVISPLKIGNYAVTASSTGFQTVSRENLHLDAQQRLNLNFTLPAGAVTQTVKVESDIPVLQTQDAAVGQVISTKEINDTPLNGRNWVYIAQLTDGVAPPFGNTRGSGSGDFVANGQRAEQNNFILDGVDNNTNLVDFLNGADRKSTRLNSSH